MNLSQHAETIPSMGGTKLGPLLRNAARSADAGTNIVEVGCWLGAGTAQLALGIRERSDPASVRLHCYDRWHASDEEVQKAAKFGVALQPGEDTLPRVRETMAAYEVPIHFHQGDLLAATWNDGPISVYVDDAAKSSYLFCHALKIFAPHWVPGKTIIVLMDFEVWKKSKSSDHMYQKRFIDAHPQAFKRIDDRHAAFLYTAAADFTPWTREPVSSRVRRRLSATARAVLGR